ncbi:UDP-galactopyranose mutase [Pantoea septica]|uniref:UDP-galactopyranose mutase n=1 Tax=Pantoea septica TaxID=472695 RepID=UPI0005357273|nr:UDP-galactopyranose mutase [Pantoea septica]
MSDKILVVGAGFSGAVVARELADNGFEVEIIDQRTHVAGNCHTERDNDTNVMLHVYGPHIFHTDKEKVWDYINKFGDFEAYIHRVKAIYNQQVYSLPINLHTINQLFGKSMNPNEAKAFVDSLTDKKDQPENFEEQALSLVGHKIYNAFLKNYTVKQWGVSPKKLPSAILKRLPLRFDYNDNYFNHKYQGMPREGYTRIVEKILDHKNIKLTLGKAYSHNMKSMYAHVFYTGSIDGFYDYKYGLLAYRTLDFNSETHESDYQGCAVINYCDKNVQYTRITEHKHFSWWEKHNKTVIYKEVSRLASKEDIPYYPIRLVDEMKILEQYINLASKEMNVTFLGRLGTYRYLDMDAIIDEALNVSDKFVEAKKENKKMPVFLAKIL